MLSRFGFMGDPPGTIGNDAFGFGTFKNPNMNRTEWQLQQQNDPLYSNAPMPHEVNYIPPILQSTDPMHNVGVMQLPPKQSIWQPSLMDKLTKPFTSTPPSNQVVPLPTEIIPNNDPFDNLTKKQLQNALKNAEAGLPLEDVESKTPLRKVQPLNAVKTTLPQQDVDTVGSIKNALKNAEQMPTTDAQGNPLPAANQKGTGDYLQDPNRITKPLGVSAQTALGLGIGTQLASLANNIMQQPPPNIQMPLTHFERVRLDRTPIDTARQAMREDANTSNRLLRENVSQASDLMRGIQGTQVNQLEAERQLGVQERELANQEMLTNNQIANQEQQIQDQQNAQELQQNYNIQAEGQRAKDQAITQNLTELNKSVTAAAQYDIIRQQQMQQEGIDLQERDLKKRIDLATLKYSSTKDYQNSLPYLTGRSAKMQEVMNTEIVNVLNELEQSGYTSYKGKEFSSPEVSGVLMGTTQTALQNELSAYQSKMSNIDAALNDPNLSESDKASVMAMKNAIATKMQTTQSKLAEANALKAGIDKRFNTSKIGVEYDEAYRKQNGVITQQEYLKMVEDAVNEK